MTAYFDLAEYYHYDHAFDFDLPFYKRYACQCGSPILELACGTGRLTIPLAQAGCEVYGLDNAPAMLALCQAAVNDQGLQDHVQLTLASMTDFQLPRRDFTLAFCALRSFMHLLTPSDQRSCLATVHQHLRPGGLFILAIIAPELRKLAQEPGPAPVSRREFKLPNGNRVVRHIYLESHDHLAQVRRFTFGFEEFDPDGRSVRVEEVPVLTRYTFRYELQYLLQAAGFERIHFYGGYEGTPYDGQGEMIVVAQRRA